MHRRPPDTEHRTPNTEGRSKAVELRGLAKRFGDVEAVKPLDLRVERGELAVLLGPSGCGKTTVLRMIAGIEEPTAGEVRIGDRSVNDLEAAERNVAMVFQNYALYPHMKVRDNLAFGLRNRRVPRPEIAARVDRAARILGLDALLDRRPGQLSGGQRQRVALGRALVREPAVFLFDEPLSNLDARLRLEMRAEIADLHRRLGATMIYVTHDQVEAMSLGDRVAVLDAGELQQCGPPLEVYARPANLFVARFVGTPPINTASGELVDGGDGRRFRAPGFDLPAPGRGTPLPGGPAVLGVRPEAIALVAPASAEAHLDTTIRRLEPLGSELLVHVEGPGGADWAVRVPPDAGLTTGSPVGLRLDPARTHIFAAAGPRLGTLAAEEANER